MTNSTIAERLRALVIAYRGAIVRAEDAKEGRTRVSAIRRLGMLGGELEVEINEAADYIDQLRKERDEAVAGRSYQKHKKEIARATNARQHEGIEHWKARAASAEAALAAAQEALAHKRTDAEIVRFAMPNAEIFTAAEIKSPGLTRKQVYNALAYLVRLGVLARIGSGKYQRPPDFRARSMEGKDG